MTPNKKAPMDKIASVKAMAEYLVNHPGVDVELDDLRAVVAKTAVIYGFRPIGPQGIAATMCLIYRRSPLYAKFAPDGIVKVRAGVYRYVPAPEPKHEAPAPPKDDQALPFPDDATGAGAPVLISIDASLKSIVKALWAMVDIFKARP